MSSALGVAGFGAALPGVAGSGEGSSTVLTRTGHKRKRWGFQGRFSSGARHLRHLVTHVASVGSCIARMIPVEIMNLSVGFEPLPRQSFLGVEAFCLGILVGTHIACSVAFRGRLYAVTSAWIRPEDRPTVYPCGCAWFSPEGVLYGPGDLLRRRGLMGMAKGVELRRLRVGGAGRAEKVGRERWERWASRPRPRAGRPVRCWLGGAHPPC